MPVTVVGAGLPQLRARMGGDQQDRKTHIEQNTVDHRRLTTTYLRCNVDHDDIRFHDNGARTSETGCDNWIVYSPDLDKSRSMLIETGITSAVGAVDDVDAYGVQAHWGRGLATNISRN